MKSKFMKGDVVEVLNITAYQHWEIGEEACKNLVGMRFQIESVSPKGFYDEAKYKFMFQTTRNGHRYELITFDQHQLLLYKRPLRNWLKALWLLIKKPS